MKTPWNILVVDDEEDVHRTTTLALKRRRWRGSSINIVDAKSAKEAREIVTAKEAPNFHAAIVDVVMETQHAGLELCDYLRATMPRSLRLVLRTGQAGLAPEDKVLNDYDIDLYLTKAEVTPERIYSAVRACLRSSSDIAGSLAVAAQLRALTAALEDGTTSRDRLAQIMTESLRFVENKYAASVAFVADATAPGSVPGADGAAFADAVASAHHKKMKAFEALPGSELGLGDGDLVVIPPTFAVGLPKQGLTNRIKRWLSDDDEVSENLIGVVLHFEEKPSNRVFRELAQDIELFLGHWQIADALLRVRDRLVLRKAGELIAASNTEL